MTARRSPMRRRLGAFGLLLIAANAAVFAALTWPRLDRVRRAETRAREVATRRASLENLWSQYAARKEVVAQNRRDLEALSRDRLKTSGEDLFATQRAVEGMARSAGLQTRRSSYSLSDVKGANLVRCDITLPLDGSYKGLTTFLSLVETAPRFLVVDQLALSQDEDGARMNLRLSAIFRKGEAIGAR